MSRETSSMVNAGQQAAITHGSMEAEHGVVFEKAFAMLRTCVKQLV